LRRLLITAACCVAALSGLSRAQAPARGVKSDSTASNPNGFTFRLGGFMVNAERNSALSKTTVQTGTGSLKGVDLLLRGSGVGISARSLAGTFANQPDVIGADVDLLLGPPAFTVTVGGARRALSTPQLTQIYTFGRIGVQLSYLIGGSGIRAQVGGAGYIPSSQDATRMKPGGEGEGSIFYTPPAVPIYFEFGYRTEVFTTTSGLARTPEEVRGLRIGAGMQFGGK
jgi:hypothetical protein